MQIKKTINEKQIKFENNYTKENKKTSYWVKKVKETKQLMKKRMFMMKSFLVERNH